MAKEDIELIERFEATCMAAQASGGGFDEVFELLHPEVVIRVCRSLPHGGEWHGHEGFAAMMAAVESSRRATNTPQFTYLDAGSHVVVLITFMSEARRTGTEVPIRMVEVFTIRDGKIASLDPYYEDTVPFWQASLAANAAE